MGEIGRSRIEINNFNALTTVLSNSFNLKSGYLRINLRKLEDNS